MTALPPRTLNRLAKERRIMDAALKVFADQGYSGTSMDAIAALAGVSKPTLYQYFGSKEQLFSAIMVAQRDSMLGAFEEPDGLGLVPELWAFSWHYADTILRPDFLSLARLIIGEAQRFPEIGRAYQSAGPERVLRGMMDYLDAKRAEGSLSFDDVELAAEDLWGLILSAPRNRALHDPQNLPSRADLHRFISNGLRVFLKAYSTNPANDLVQLNALSEQGPTRGTP
jgi:TetR/AcrR family transcriptional regulator, mexJK operon transcriptional repressor